MLEKYVNTDERKEQYICIRKIWMDCWHLMRLIKPKMTTVLNQHHGVRISERRLKYICKKQGLSGKRNVNSEILKDMVINELGTSSSLLGYRQMTEILAVRYGVSISKEDVRKTLKNIGLDGVTIRRNKVIRRRICHTIGPDYIYHIDGNDKLKRWGFSYMGALTDSVVRSCGWFYQLQIMTHFLLVTSI